MSLTSCIISPYAKNKQGYASKKHNKKNYYHHRWVYAQHNNIDLDSMQGLVVMHLCDNPACVNPDHLRLGTQLDNIKDRDAKDRQARGERAYSNKLTEADVIAIRGSHLTQDQLAEDYRVRQQTISRIKRGVTWKHLL